MTKEEINRIRDLSERIKEAGGSISVLTRDEALELENLLLKWKTENDPVENN